MKKSITLAAGILAGAFALGSVASADSPAAGIPRTNPMAEPLIVGGMPARSAQGAVSLSLTDKGLFCTGTLIAPEWVVSAAHCAFMLADPAHPPKPVADMRVRYDSLNHAEGGREVAVEDVFVHPGWSWGQPAESPVDDIALFKLAEPARGAEYVAVTPIPAPVGTDVRVMGWGRTQADGTGEPAEALQQLDTAITHPGQCASAPPAFHEGTDLCVANPAETGMCMGDSGGATIANRAGRPELVGVNSRSGAGSGLPCGDDPDVSTAVSAYWGWMVIMTARAGAALAGS